MRDQRWWTWHVAAGAVILVLLGLHMAIMHLNAILGLFNAPGTEPIEWTNVVERAKSGFFMVTYVVLLGAALFHGLYGLRNMLFELNPGAGVKKGVDLLFVVGGVALFVFGTWAAYASFQVAMTQSAAAAAL
jgi:succinate dehydrogenase / fumarate reductase membrane anchor subunit